MKDKVVTETGTCILCGGPFSHWGNNPEPVRDFDDGRCCDDCNATIVIPARLGLGRKP